MTAKTSTAVINYQVICVVALLVLLLALSVQGLWPWALLPVAVGGLGVLFRWGSAAGLVLLAVGGLLFVDAFVTMDHYFGMAAASQLIADILLCAAVLTYAAASCRLAGLTTRLFPVDPRQSALSDPFGSSSQERREAARREPPAYRSPDTVGPLEIGLLFLIVPVCVVLGQLGWLWLGNRESPVLHMADEVWQLLLLLRTLILAALVGAAILGYLRWNRMSAAEARMVLQDTAWQETRLEQRVLGRWVAWVRRRQRRKEKT